jgi:2-keto-4-pentenoate hydratase/2-oxohepta-3-ene-1,7-dioic acid hydratase in catechol pathway
VRATCAAARDGDPAGLPCLDPAEVVFLPPVPDPGTVFAIGLNYASHCVEQGRPTPEEPLFFLKATSCLVGHRHPIVAWPLTQELDFEGELAVIIGRGGRAIPESEALAHCFGWTILHDVSARDLQRNDRQWSRAKGLDTFGPTGPFMATRDEVPDPQALRVRTWVNGEPVQDAATSEMAFPVARLVAHLSEAITLRPGDIVSTGTPGGVGLYRKPPRFLVPGDVVRIRIDGIGELENPVVSP